MLELGVPKNHGYFFWGTYGKKYPTWGLFRRPSTYIEACKRALHQSLGAKSLVRRALMMLGPSLACQGKRASIPNWAGAVKTGHDI